MRLHIQRILCPTDFSPFSARALDHAVRVARWTGAEIVVLHVNQPVFADVPPPLGGDTRERLLADLELFAVPARAARVETRTRLEDGVVVNRIVEVAREIGADLVAMGTHGRSGFEHFLLGSVTEKVIRKAPCPVLTVRDRAVPQPEAEIPFDRVVCPTDFSAAAARAVDLTFALAGDTHGHITLLHVVESLPVEDALVSGRMDLVEHLQRRETALAEQLARAVPPGVAGDSPPQCLLGRGKPSREIVRIARETDAQLVVLGVHGHNPVHVAVFGSTAHAVLRDAPCAVLTVREKG